MRARADAAGSAGPGRIRRRGQAATSLVVGCCLGVCVGGTAQAQVWTGMRVDIGMIAGTRWVEDGNGTDVRQRLGATGGLEMALGRRSDRGGGAAPTPTVAIRGSLSPLRASGEGTSRSVGAARVMDLALGIESPLAPGVRAQLAVTRSWLAGPRDLIPFRAYGGGVEAWGFDARITRSLRTSTPLRAVIGIHALRLPSGTGADGVTMVGGGWVARARIELQYAH